MKRVTIRSSSTAYFILIICLQLNYAAKCHQMACLLVCWCVWWWLITWTFNRVDLQIPDRSSPLTRCNTKSHDAQNRSILKNKCHSVKKKIKCLVGNTTHLDYDFSQRVLFDRIFLRAVSVPHGSWTLTAANQRSPAEVLFVASDVLCDILLDCPYCWMEKLHEDRNASHHLYL